MEHAVFLPVNIVIVALSDSWFPPEDWQLQNKPVLTVWENVPVWAEKQREKKKWLGYVEVSFWLEEAKLSSLFLVVHKSHHH